MKKIGIMGGTFNPIHKGHLLMGKLAYEQAGLDEIWFMASKNPPHKRDMDLAGENHRANMVKLATTPVSYFNYSDFELRRDGITYTADTLSLLKKEYQDCRFYFIIGGDSFFQFHTWYHPEIILANVTLLVFGRDDISKEDMVSRKKELLSMYPGEVLLLDMPHIPISSSMIRQKIATNEDVSEYVPKSVQDYITLHHLY